MCTVTNHLQLKKNYGQRTSRRKTEFTFIAFFYDNLILNNSYQWKGHFLYFYIRLTGWWFSLYQSRPVNDSIEMNSIDKASHTGIKVGPKGALGSHEIRPIHSAPSLGQSIVLWKSGMLVHGVSHSRPRSPLLVPSWLSFTISNFFVALVTLPAMLQLL